MRGTAQEIRVSQKADERLQRQLAKKEQRSSEGLRRSAECRRRHAEQERTKELPQAERERVSAKKGIHKQDAIAECERKRA